MTRREDPQESPQEGPQEPPSGVCHRCRGLVVEERVPFTYRVMITQWRCLNCGSLRVGEMEGRLGVRRPDSETARSRAPRVPRSARPSAVETYRVALSPTVRLDDL